MADRQTRTGREVGDGPGSTTSSVPLLGDGFQEQPRASPASATVPSDSADLDAKPGKNRFWNLMRKKNDDKTKKKKESQTTASNPPATSAPQIRAESPLPSLDNVPHIAESSSHPYGLPSSPGRNLNSSSPAPPSPASSQIFERSVQEDNLLAAAASPAIPAHITTENHIPPVLDASSVAITDDRLDPDEVEIVMHAAHQPAAVTVAGAGNESLNAPNLEDLPGHGDGEENASNYGALDTTDVRRLSFISFADVVHAEHADHTGSIMSGAVSPVVSHNRSPSPARSPLSSQMLAGSPILSSSVSSKGLEISPNRGIPSLTSPIPSQSPPTSGELTIETMRQALRKTGSGDLSGAKSASLSGTGNEDDHGENAIK